MRECALSEGTKTRDTLNVRRGFHMTLGGVQGLVLLVDPGDPDLSRYHLDGDHDGDGARLEVADNGGIGVHQHGVAKWHCRRVDDHIRDCGQPGLCSVATVDPVGTWAVAGECPVFLAAPSRRWPSIRKSPGKGQVRVSGEGSIEIVAAFGRGHAIVRRQLDVLEAVLPANQGVSCISAAWKRSSCPWSSTASARRRSPSR